MFKTKRFGMFIHWGLYSIRGFHEQEQYRDFVPSKEYVKYMTRFNPTEYDPKEWVCLAKQAGFDYIVFTTKHHDGFCMWDTAYTDFKITNTPYGKDVLKMLSEECEKQGMGLSLYYSCPDWHHPNYLNTIGHHEIDEVKEGDNPSEPLYIEYVKNQIRELLTGYGKIQSFFWDIPPKTRDKSLNELIRSLQPGIYINNRGYDEGDFSTPERTSADGAVFEGLTEACDSIGAESWGYRKNEDYHSKLYLTSSIDRYMAMGANFVLNAGPDDKGRIPDVSQKILQSVGEWYGKVKEALFATPVKYECTSKKGILTTISDNTLYLHFPSGHTATGFFLEDIACMPKSVTLLNSRENLHFTFEKIPRLFNGKRESMREVLHINGIDFDRFSCEAIIIKIEFEDIKTAFTKASENTNTRIL